VTLHGACPQVTTNSNGATAANVATAANGAAQYYAHGDVVEANYAGAGWCRGTVVRVESTILVMFDSDNKVEQYYAWEETGLRRPRAQKNVPWRVGDNVEKLFGKKWEKGIVQVVSADVTVLFDEDKEEDMWAHESAGLRHV
jgi:hypothetical protein